MDFTLYHACSHTITSKCQKFLKSEVGELWYVYHSISSPQLLELNPITQTNQFNMDFTLYHTCTHTITSKCQKFAKREVGERNHDMYIISATAGTWPNHPNQSIFYEIHFIVLLHVYIISAWIYPLCSSKMIEHLKIGMSNCLINIYLKNSPRDWFMIAV